MSVVEQLFEASRARQAARDVDIKKEAEFDADVAAEQMGLMID